ncbi:MAG: DUF349 domain-containing protein [Luteitalea sp.]|nr:DUF349 domain-containing protein [Luteitalea sp.]
MSLLDRFRQPRWKHPDRAVRASAVEELGDEEQDVLRAIAREDEDAAIRRRATARLDDPALLAEIARTDTSQEVRDEARALLLDLALDEQDPARAEAALAAIDDERDLAILVKQATSEALGLSAVGRLSSERILASTARHAAHRAVRLAALERVQDSGERLAVATKSEHKDVALAALMGVTDPEQLEQVAARARNKLVARRARALLRAQAPTPNAELPEEPMPDADEICARLEGASAATDPRLVAYRLDEAEALWAEQDDAVRQAPEPAARFEAARQSARRHLEVLESERRAREEARSRHEAVLIPLCERIEGVEGEDIPEALAAAAEAWSAQDHTTVDPELTGRFERAVQSAEARHRRWRDERERVIALEALATKAEATVELPDLADAHAQWADVLKGWTALGRPVTGGPVTGGPITAGPVTAGPVTDAASPDASTDETLVAESGTGAFLGASLGASLVARFRAAEGRLAARAAEAREAQARERRQRLEQLSALCSRLEALVERHDLTLKDADQAWRDARTAADDIGNLPSRQDHLHMAGRLRAVQTTLFAKLQEIREVDDWKRWANAGVQEEICQQVEALREVEDVLEVAPKLRDLRQQWKQVSSGPRGEEGSVLWQRFRTAVDQAQVRCDAYFAQRAVEEADRVHQKQTLCERAEALTDSTDWLRTAEELKQLQLQWQSIGSLRGEQARELAARFRSACDRFFTRRKEDLTQRKALWSANQAKKEALIQQAEAIADTTDWAKGLETLKRLQIEWKAVGPVKRQKSEALWKRFRTVCDRFFDRYKNRHQIEIEAAKDAREQLISELEALLPAPAAEPSAVHDATPAPHEGEVLTANDPTANDPTANDTGSPQASEAARPDAGGADPEGPPPVDVRERVESIWRRWRTAPLVPSGLHAVLEDRFAVPYGRLIDLHPAMFRHTSLDPNENLRQMGELCGQVEGLLSQLGMQSLENRPTVALASLLKEALASNTIAGRVDDQARRRTALDTVRASQAMWRTLGPAPGEQGRLLTARFNRACRRFFDQQGGGSRKKVSSPSRPQGNGRNKSAAATGGPPPRREAATDFAASMEPPPPSAERKQSSSDR